ncbi:carboxymuconolactone decarboxylase family protein [Pseudofrankia inefficax]|uniref:Carboxymuconolactone decarboxylase n=1 Tax=Pseudofrankia inefficax (strain DSM 45817 / CECT 9037 / DDB 130130 / EuI1c) TaxID=298654 RepID=E3IU78_PSEI1|nr:carboxymuconolactone decarboxylase family protein [Pseudofrankia inefficax]ADP82415.1 Carboxymuconolactone decarboxylase [Pseudofrankia inefficax]
MTARISPMPPEEWPPALTTFIADFRSAVIGDKAADGGGGQSGVNLLGTLAHYPELTREFLSFNGHILYGTTLSARQRELLVLRVAALRKCDYEWAQHTILARDAGLRDEEIRRVPDGPDAPGWSLVERSLLRAVDELLADARVGDETWSVLAHEFDERQLMDVIFTVGTYEMVAFALRSFAVEPEPDLAPYLPVATGSDSAAR